MITQAPLSLWIGDEIRIGEPLLLCGGDAGEGEDESGGDQSLFHVYLQLALDGRSGPVENFIRSGTVKRLEPRRAASQYLLAIIALRAGNSAAIDARAKKCGRPIERPRFFERGNSDRD
jgi:hypothetical protein